MKVTIAMCNDLREAVRLLQMASFLPQSEQNMKKKRMHSNSQSAIKGSNIAGGTY